MWAYRTTSRRSTGETRFSLTYGAEAVILAEVNMCSARIDEFDPIQNELMMVERLDLLGEYRESAVIRLAKYQQKLARCYNRDVKAREFSTGDLVLRRVVGICETSMPENWP